LNGFHQFDIPNFGDFARQGNDVICNVKNIILSESRPVSLQRLAMRRRRLDFSDAFALVLQRHREAKKISRQALAEKAGLHQTYVGMIERTLSNPSLDTANAIAEALNIPLSKLIIEAEKERERAE
jgi:DNA-binding XRE family transcriptional regulator